MDALIVETIGQPIIKRKRKVPQANVGEVLIKVTVVGLNPYEHRIRDWGLFVEGQLPLVIGNDIAGIVSATSDQAGLQEYAVLDAFTVAKVPEGFTDDDGASLVCNLVAPFWAIFGKDGLFLPFPFPDDPKPTIDYSQETILIIGAGSNCGKYAVQICKLAGFGTIIATASLGKNESTLRSYGATHVIDRHAADVSAQIRSLVGDSLIYALDAVNLDHTLGVSLLSNSQKGTLVCMVPRLADLGAVGEKKAGFEDKFVQGQSHNQPELGAKFWKWLPVWMKEGKIRSTGWDVLEGRGLDADKVNWVLDQHRDGKTPARQWHVHL